MSSLDPPAGRGSSRRSFLARAALLAAAAATPAGLLAQAGADGLGDVEEAIAPTVTEASLSAPEYLARTIAAHPGEIAVVAVGPATNLLLAQLIRPSIVEEVGRVGIMGGAVGFAGERGNKTTVGEANAWNDPHALDSSGSSERSIRRRRPRGSN